MTTETGTYTPRISTTVVPPDPNEAMVEWSDGNRYSFYIKLPRYIANAIIADYEAASREAALREERDDYAQRLATTAAALEARLAAVGDAAKDLGVELINAATKLKAAEDALREIADLDHVELRARGLSAGDKAIGIARAALAQEQQEPFQVARFG